MENQASRRLAAAAVGIILALALVAIAVVAVMAAIEFANHTSDEAGTNTENQSRLDSISRRIDVLQTGVNTLNTKTVGQEAQGDGTGRPTPPPPSTRANGMGRPTPTPTPTPSGTRTPTSMPIATLHPPTSLAGPGICGRSRVVQHTLINWLRISSCQVINDPELFRITALGDIEFDTSPQPGDFAGLVNLKELQIDIHEGSVLTAGALYGLTGLKRLTLLTRASEETPVTIEPGAFQGLTNLEELQIHWSTDEPRARVSVPPLEGTPNLETLGINTHDRIFTPQASHFQNLPNLKSIQIRGSDYSDSTPSWFRLPADIFQNNAELETVEIYLETNGIRITVARETLSQLDELKNVSLRPSSEPEISLSPNSPLMKDILNGNASPQGYTLIPPGAN